MRPKGFRVDNGSTMNSTSRIGEHPTRTEQLPELDNTGERFLPGAMFSAEVAYDHFARYRLAERYFEGKNIVEMGCGAGYGTHSLARVTGSIMGVDLSEEAVSYASRRYNSPNLRYQVGDVTNLPYEAGSFDAAVSFEVIEHLERPEDLVLEAKRLIRDDGIFVVSTPDKQTYSNERNSVNPHHLKEMYPLEFKEILERNFEHVQIYRQGALAGSIITPDQHELPEDGNVTLESAQFSLPNLDFGSGLPTTLYMIAVCTNGEPPEPLTRPIMILDRDRQVYEEFTDWRTIVAQLRAYFAYERNKRMDELNQRLQDTNQRLQDANQRLQDSDRRLREVRQQSRREIEIMQSSRGWKVARGLNIVATKVRGALGGGR